MIQINNRPLNDVDKNNIHEFVMLFRKTQYPYSWLHMHVWGEICLCKRMHTPKSLREWIYSRQAESCSDNPLILCIFKGQEYVWLFHHVFLRSTVKKDIIELYSKKTKKRLHNKNVYGWSLATQFIFVVIFAMNLHKLISLRFVGSFHIEAENLWRNFIWRKKSQDH